ncbi:ABC transporter substrate-binding protein [Pseudonocardia acaciae]|uniref:ABC transporter substrate-binding protein n=1 Tax=Pseudonocardia acaciae TaxID=551276 RepID=UPI00048DBE50|nr:extracellular solute-binding protein [Pseudonocardia acaciae]
MIRFRRLAACGVALLLTAACASGKRVDTAPGSGDDDGAVHLTMFIWAGSHQGDVPRQVVKQYLASHPGVTIDFVESNNTVTYPKMVAAKRTTPNDNYVDFGFFNASTLAQGEVDGMWDPLNPSAIPNMATVLPAYRTDGDRGVGYQATVFGLLYNKDKVPAPPESWSALWDPAFAGRVTTFDYQWQALTLAARLGGGGEHNIEPGFRTWSQRANQFKALVSSNDQLKNLLVTGDAWVAPWFSAIARDWIREGAPLGFTVPREGGIAFPTYLAVVTNLSPERKKVAQEVINLLLDAGNAGRYGELTGSIPLVRDARFASDDPNQRIEVAERAMRFDWVSIAKNDAAWRQRWDRDVKSQMR